MKPIKKTKIVATLGPSCDEQKIIEKMILAGVNVFRVNFSHAKYEEVEDRIKKIRQADKKLNTQSAILADLQGPKLRVGQIEKGSVVHPDDEVVFSTHTSFVGNAQKAYMNYQQFPKDVTPGEKILLDDGKLIFEVISTDKNTEVTTRVLQGGPFKSNKGVNLPNTNISLPALTEKDVKDAEFIFTQDVDWIALSFVRHSEDVLMLKNLMKKHLDEPLPVISKIEKPEAIENIDKIIAYSEGLMVARGDLGVEVPVAEVPLLQKELVLLSKKARIPIIIATQMMETMTESLTPTRAEVNDVANSVMDGADAVMLSGETSVGKYPVEVVETVRTIVMQVENSKRVIVPQDPPNIRTKRFITKSVCFHAAQIATDIKAKAICTLTNSGYTAYQISAWRPISNILVFTSNKRILTQLSLLWGVKAFYYCNFQSTDNTVEEINSIAHQKGYVRENDLVVNLTAMPISKKGMVNTLRVSVI
tara:strand:+ start:1049 stop:2476 length:1428 start_codon:yes stop_codon:yes gene_type:complete